MALLGIRTLDDLAQYLGFSEYESMKGLVYPVPFYRAFQIPKRAGGLRTIEAPGHRLKEIQRRIATDLTLLFGRRSSSAHSFVPGRSPISNALPHVLRAAVFRVDLENFFHQINFGRIKGLFLADPFSFPDDVASVLAHICCFNGRLPQGAPTSPILSNYITMSLDSRLRKLATRYKARYTRYSDDLTFSFETIPLERIPREMFLVSIDAQKRPIVEPGLLLKEVINEQGFVINLAKTRGAGRGQRQMVTGVVVNDGLRVPARFVSQMRRALHLWRKFGVSDASNRAIPVLRRTLYASGAEPSLPQLFRGKLAWLGAVNGRSDNHYQNLAKVFNALVVRDKLPELQVEIDPKVKNFEEAKSATWFLRAETEVGEYDVIEGTAFKVSGHEWVTCAHCVGSLATCQSYERLQVSSGDWQHKSIAVRVSRIDWHRDIAILRPMPMTPLPRHLAYFSTANYVPIAPAVVGVIGFPSSIEHQPPVFFRARVVRTRTVSGVLRIEIDKQIQQGNSGGPVFDDAYRLVGVVVEGGTVTAGMNSCISATEIANL